MDLKTLWERTNDAINTIIRRDESTENGKLLQPCIEGKPFKFDLKGVLFNPTCISAFGLFSIVESNLGST
jgi:hypothetical protein